MPLQRFKILSIEKYLGLYGSCFHPALFAGEVCRIAHRGLLLATCPVHEALVNTSDLVRQITLQTGPGQWNLYSTLVGLARANEPFTLQLEKENTPEPIEFELHFHKVAPRICRPYYHLTMAGSGYNWSDGKKAIVSINNEQPVSGMLHRPLFNRQAGPGIFLEEEAAEKISKALLRGVVCWLECDVRPG